MKSKALLYMIFAALSSASPASALGQGADDRTVIPLDLSAVRPTVSLTIGGGPAMPAVMDTGSMKTIVNLNLAAEAGFTNDGPLEHPFNQMSASGYQTTITSASISGVPLPTISAPVIPLPLPDHVVVFSPGVFSGNYVTFDFSKAQMSLRDKGRQASPTGEQYSYSSPPLELPTIPVTIGSDTFNAHLDTGSAYGLIFPTAFAERLPLSEPLKESGEAAGHSSKRPLYKSRIRGIVRVGPISVENPEVLFTDVAPYANIGMKFLEQFQITLDPEDKRLWVEKL